MWLQICLTDLSELTLSIWFSSGKISNFSLHSFLKLLDLVNFSLLAKSIHRIIDLWKLQWEVCMIYYHPRPCLSILWSLLITHQRSVSWTRRAFFEVERRRSHRKQSSGDVHIRVWAAEWTRKQVVELSIISSYLMSYVIVSLSCWSEQGRTRVQTSHYTRKLLFSMTVATLCGNG